MFAKYVSVRVCLHSSLCLRYLLYLLPVRSSVESRSEIRLKLRLLCSFAFVLKHKYRWSTALCVRSRGGERVEQVHRDTRIAQIVLSAWRRYLFNLVSLSRLAGWWGLDVGYVNGQNGNSEETFTTVQAGLKERDNNTWFVAAVPTMPTFLTTQFERSNLASFSTCPPKRIR